jgi:hypothetical protein
MSIATMTVIGFRKKRPARSRRLARIAGKSRPESVAAAPQARASGVPASPATATSTTRQAIAVASALGFEDLNGLKRGKSQSRGKNFRIATAPWTYRRVRQRIESLARENRVWPIVLIREAPPEHVPLVVRTIGATAWERRFDVSLRSQRRCRFHRRSKRLDQDPRGTRAHGLSPRPEMSAIQENVSGQTVKLPEDQESRTPGLFA